MAGTLAELLVKLGVRVDGSLKAEDQLKKLKKRAHEFGSEADSTTTKVKRLVSGLANGLVKGAALAAGAVGAYGLALGKLVLDKAEAADATAKLARSLGMGGEELQRLQFAASQSGAEADKLSQAMKFLNKAMLDSESGGGKALTDGLADLGLRVSDLDNLSRTQQIGLIGDRLNEIGDDAERAAMAAQIFGEEAGPALASMLAEGSAGLEKLSARAKGVLSEDQLANAEAFQNSLGEFKRDIAGLTDQLGAELLPLAQEWLGLAQQWLDQNEEFIAQNFAATVEFTVDVVRTLVQEAGSLVDIVAALSKAMSQGAKDSSTFGQIMAALRAHIVNALTPFTQLKTLAGEMAYLLEDLGLISTKSANDFNRAMGNIETSSRALDVASGKYRELAMSADDARRAMEQHQIGEALYGKGFRGPVSPEEMERGKKRLEELKRERERSRIENRRARAAGPPKKEEKKKEDKPKLRAFTRDELIRRLGSGGTIAENLSAMASPTPSTAPSMTIHYTDNSTHHTHVNKGAIEVNGAGDPAAVASEVVKGLEDRVAHVARRTLLRENARAARTILNPVVR